VFSEFKFCPANRHFTHLSPPPEVCDISRQAAQYHILSLEVSGFISLTRYLTGYRVIKFSFCLQKHKYFMFSVRNMLCSVCFTILQIVVITSRQTTVIRNWLSYIPRAPCFVNYVLCSFVSLFEDIISAA
jgi:hypothetical protein